MDHDEFLLWTRYYAVEPWGSELEQLNAGIIAATIENCRANRPRGKASQPIEYMPFAARNDKLTRKPQSKEEQIRAARAMAEMFKGILKFTDNSKKDQGDVSS